MAKGRPRLLPPDWGCSLTTCGAGSIRDLPRPYVREFPRPDGRRRDVRITVSTWIGFGGAHFYVNVSPEPNRVWDGRADEFTPVGTWREFADDPRRWPRGVWDLDGRFDTRDGALEHVKRLRRRFRRGWEVRVEDYAGDLDSRGYAYRREGD